MLGLRLWSTRAALVIALCTLCAAAGCNIQPGVPRHRFGSLPFPGLLTLYRTADPDRLGTHRYGRELRPFWEDEAEGGIVYTRRAGFLDVAHMRITVDWTRYYARQLRPAIEAGRERLIMPTLDDGTLTVELHYPSDWESMCADDPALPDELALRAGQVLAVQTMTWHEVLTWYGFGRIPLLDESPSSFTYDDPMSHVIGARVAERALRDDGRPFDRAVTVALREELRALGALSGVETTRTARAVRGLWWADSRPLKRQVEMGSPSDGLRPWLVPRATAGVRVEPERFPLPTLADVCGKNFSGFLAARMSPPTAQVAGRMRARLAGTRGRDSGFSCDEDLGRLIDAVREEMRDRYAAEIDQPWPDEAPADRPFDATGAERHAMAPATR